MNDLHPCTLEHRGSSGLKAAAGACGAVIAGASTQPGSPPPPRRAAAKGRGRRKRRRRAMSICQRCFAPGNHQPCPRDCEQCLLRGHGMQPSIQKKEMQPPGCLSDSVDWGCGPPTDTRPTGPPDNTLPVIRCRAAAAADRPAARATRRCPAAVRCGRDTSSGARLRICHDGYDAPTGRCQWRG